MLILMVSSFSHRPLTFQMPLRPLWPVKAPCLSARGLANISSTTVTRHADAIYPVCSFALSRWHTRCAVCWKYWGSVVWAPAFHRRRWPWAWQWLLPSPPHQIAPNGVKRQRADAWACGEQVASCKVVTGSVETRMWTGECWPVLLSALICQIDLKALARCAPAPRRGSWLSLKRDR